MKHSESEYIQAGYRYERAPTPNAAIAEAQRMRMMIESEHPDEQSEARRLIALGIDEARKTQPNPTQPNPTQPNPTQPNPTQPNQLKGANHAIGPYDTTGARRRTPSLHGGL